MTSFDAICPVDILKNLVRRIAWLFFDFGGDNIGDKMGVRSGVFQMGAGTVVMFINKFLDPKPGHIVLTGIQTPRAPIILAAHIELVRVVPDYFHWKLMLNRIGRTGLF
jgi:hypothetical protein